MKNIRNIIRPDRKNMCSKILCDKNYLRRHRKKIELNGYWYIGGY